MSRSRLKSKGRNSSGRFAGIPLTVMASEDYVSLSGNGVRLLLELARQYNGHNNGNLSAAYSQMQERGFRSRTTLAKALKELQDKTLILCTRAGYFANPGSRCALYALTWQSIDECRGKSLEVLPTTVPPRRFSLESSKTPGSESGLGATKKWTDEAA